MYKKEKSKPDKVEFGFLVPLTRLELVRDYSSTDSKSVVSANSTTAAAFTKAQRERVCSELCL